VVAVREPERVRRLLSGGGANRSRICREETARSNAQADRERFLQYWSTMVSVRRKFFDFASHCSIIYLRAELNPPGPEYAGKVAVAHACQFMPCDRRELELPLKIARRYAGKGKRVTDYGK